MKIFEKELKEEEYQNIINYLKIHYKELRDEKDSNILSNKIPQILILIRMKILILNYLLNVLHW